MNLIGRIFGRLEVVSQFGVDKHRNIIWICECKCGKQVLQRTNTLNMGLAKSCGCLLRETARKRMLGNKNPMWRDKASLGALHTWIRTRKKKPELCQRCKRRVPQDLANISGVYTRNLSDYKWLCRKCHMKIDGRFDRRKKNGQFERSGKC
jgi:uncharacterized protein YlaI